MKKWTEEEIEWLKENFPHKQFNEIEFVSNFFPEKLETLLKYMKETVKITN